MSFPTTRVVLQANIGQYNSVARTISNALITFANTDVSGSAKACTIFAKRNQFSSAIGDPVYCNFLANKQIFLRRVRIASEQTVYGAKTLNEGGYGLIGRSPTPSLRANSSWFSIWANNYNDNSFMTKIYESETIPVLNEWYDVNQIISPFGVSNANIPFFFSGIYNLEIDYTSATALNGKNVQLRLEMEIDCPSDAFGTVPNVPPTTPLNSQMIGHFTPSLQNGFGEFTIRTVLKNIYSSPIVGMDIFFAFADSNTQIEGVYVGPADGSHNFVSSQQVLFSGGGTYTPPAGANANSIKIVKADTLTLSSPVAPNNEIMISVASIAGNTTFWVGFTQAIENLSNLVSFAGGLAGNHANDASGASFVNGYAPHFSHINFRF